MDHIFYILQKSTNNDERQAAQAQLRNIQEKEPHQFLVSVIPVALGSNVTQEDAFFASTVLLEFVDQFWRLVPDETKTWALQTILDAVTSTPMPVHQTCGVARCRPHLRKLCVVLAVMIKLQTPRKLTKDTSGSSILPQVLAAPLHLLCAAVENRQDVQLQSLVAIHFLLKEMASKRVGKIFETVCLAILPHLSRWLSTTSSDPQHRVTFVWCLKVALRVYGYGCFNPAALLALLSSCYQFAGEITTLAADSPLRAATVRSLEYCCKIVVVALETFAPRLSELTLAFFVDLNPQGHSLFQFVCSALSACWAAREAALLEKGCGDDDDNVFSNKLACRCMRLLQQLTTRDEGDAFIAEVLGALSRAPVCRGIMRLIIQQYLADDSRRQLSQWKEDPEAFVAELDVVDDETEPCSCAEQLFLALTTSTSTSDLCVTIAWEIVNDLLTVNTDEAVTAALHAIGLGYAALATHPSHYVSFLQARLLPLVTSGCASPLVLRRVVWVIGMWCESVEGIDLRQQVHRTLATILRPESDPVVLLTTMRAVEHFVSDNNFSIAELHCMGTAFDSTCGCVLPVYLSQILACLRHVIPHLRSAAMIKEVVGLCLVLTEKRALSEGGEVMMFVLRPAVEHFRQVAEKLQLDTNTRGGTDDDEAGSTELSTFGLILETLASAVKITSSMQSIWEHYDLVVFTTNPQNVVSTWTQDFAWELLLRMVHYTTGPVDEAVTSKLAGSFKWALCHLERDFESLGTVLRCLAALVALLKHTIPSDLLTTLMQKVLSALFVTDGSVFQGYVFVASVLIAEYPSSVIPVLLTPLLEYHHSVEGSSVQEDERLPAIAVLLAQVVNSLGPKLDSCATDEHRRLIASVGAAQSLMEKWSLILDVSPNMFATKSITFAAVTLAQQGWLVMDEDLTMARAALQSFESSETPESANPGGFSPTGGCKHNHGEGLHFPHAREMSVDSTAAEMALDDVELERREPLEVLLEWLGDGDLSVSAPHASRLALLYNIPAQRASVESSY